MVCSYDFPSFPLTDHEFNKAEFCNPGLLGTVSRPGATAVLTKRAQMTIAPFERSMKIQSLRAGHPGAQQSKQSLERQNSKRYTVRLC